MSAHQYLCKSARLERTTVFMRSVKKHSAQNSITVSAI